MTSATGVPPELPPEIPAPGHVPRRPGHAPDAPLAPAVAPPAVLWDEGPAGDARQHLLGMRRVMLTGTLDEATVTRAAAELMLLDGTSSQPVELLVNSDGGPLLEVLGLLDVLDLMRAPVATRCLGRATGTAAIVLAGADGGRAAAVGARICLRLEDHHEVSGRATEIERFVDQLERARDGVVARLVRVSTLDAPTVARELAQGAPMGAREALARGLIDEVLGR